MTTPEKTLTLGIPKEEWVPEQRGISKLKYFREEVSVRFAIGDQVALLTDDHKMKIRKVEGVHVDLVHIARCQPFSERQWCQRIRNSGHQGNVLRISYTLSKPWRGLPPHDYITERKVEECNIYTLEEATRVILSFHEGVSERARCILDEIADTEHEERLLRTLSYPPTDVIQRDEES